MPLSTKSKNITYRKSIHSIDGIKDALDKVINDSTYSSASYLCSIVDRLQEARNLLAAAISPREEI